MISQSNLNTLNTLAIVRYTQTRNNGLFDYYGTITASFYPKIILRNDGYITGSVFFIQKMKSFLLAGYQGLCNISTQFKHIFWMDAIAKVRTRYAPKQYFQRRPISISGHVREDLFGVTTREKIVFRRIRARGYSLAVMGRESSILGDVRAYGGIFGRVRNEFCQSIKTELLNYLITQLNNKTVILNFNHFETITHTRARQIKQISNFNLIDYLEKNLTKLFLPKLQSKSLGLQDDVFKNISYKQYPSITIAIINIIVFINYFPNRILQAVLTHPEKDSLFFLACWLIASSKSSSKRIVCRVLLVRSYNFLDFCSCIGSNHYDIFLNDGANHFKVKYLKKQCPNVLRAQLRHLTTNIKDANAMANSNDTLHPKNGQQHLSTLYSVLKLYQADIAQTNLSTAESHFDELQQAISSGIGAIGNLMYWATESDNYETEQLKNDIRDIGYLFSQLEQVSQFAGRERSNLNFKKLNPAINIQCY